MLNKDICYRYCLPKLQNTISSRKMYCNLMSLPFTQVFLSLIYHMSIHHVKTYYRIYVSTSQTQQSKTLTIVSLSYLADKTAKRQSGHNNKYCTYRTRWNTEVTHTRE